MSSRQRPLFGGAIVSNIPAECVDASELRQVPDNQEVFVYPNSQISIIVEILERVPQHEDEAAARFHFISLAQDNSAVSNSVESVVKIQNNRGDETPSPTVLVGDQLVPKFNSALPDQVNILLALFRVERKNVDLVLSMNIPLRTAKGNAGDAECQRAQRDFDAAVKSLEIVNFGLFV